MFNPFVRQKKTIANFIGGICPPVMKEQSLNVALRKLPLPDKLIIPLLQHQGTPGEIKVKQGCRVLKGQPLTSGTDMQVPVHAPTSGVISAIDYHVTTNPNPVALCIHLKPDGHDNACIPYPVRNYLQEDPLKLIHRLHLAGIVGLGGAGFPTAKKLQNGLLNNIDILIINAAESEPYVTADERLMQEHAAEILQGIQILMHILKPEKTIIAIESNKSQAIAALHLVLPDSPDIQLQLLAPKYPSGSTRQLTTMLTGRRVPSGQHSSAVRVLTQNVSTTFAVKRAIIDGQPLTERVVTLAGGALTSPGNIWVRTGTPARYLLNNAGFNPSLPHILVMGGPLMGTRLPNTDVPVMKTSNCLLAMTSSETAVAAAEQPCIRCGICADVCPAGLLPQQLYWFSRSAEHEKARQHHLFDCMECGACAFVCPSQIPLVQYYQQEKARIRAQDEENARATAAKARFEAKNRRLVQEKQTREWREKSHQPVPTEHESNTYKKAVAMAVARIEARKSLAVTQEPPEQQDNIPS